MGIAIGILSGFLIYFGVAVFTAHRSWKAFWINFGVAILLLSLLAASHTDHTTSADGLVELFLVALFVVLFIVTGFAWLCSLLIRAADNASQDPGIDV
ncbi:hypothetical protein [Montanilutibacter psychrotolerans]|nr:hypothetical protein [Lysobacter psychrotolerans]